MRRFTIVTALFACLLTSAAVAADLPGSKDPAFLKRYEGSEIVYSATRPYDRYKVAVLDKTSSSNWKWSDIEGQISRLAYREPPGHTVLELMRNYEQALKDAGFTLSTELDKGTGDVNFAWYFWLQNNAFTGQPVYGFLKADGYLAAKATKDNQDITVAIFFAQYSGKRTVEQFKPSDFEPEQIAVVVDVVTAKAVEIKMVEVKAADMADALATKGSIDLYGIYFDVDKAEIKAESSKTLDEVASLLKIDRSLKLEISGHTDNTGDKTHNMQLSEARAKAVVDVLVKKYNIDPARLQAKGYGDTQPIADNNTTEGKAKNRRVELKKI